jgi:hypothetical protein
MPENNDIKAKLEAIINNTPYGGDSSIVNPDTSANGFSTGMTQKADRNLIRERLSLAVLSDIIHAMMHDETNEDLDEMIDDRIMAHIQNDYKGTCSSYLCKAYKNTDDETIGNIVQEIENQTEEVAKSLEDPNDNDTEEIDTSDLLSGVENYEELRERLKEEVSKRVVNDVAKVIGRKSDSPTFDDIDEKLQKADEKNDDVLKESAIITMSGAIVVEYALRGEQISTEDSLNMAIVEYCINQMDYLFKQKCTANIHTKYGV